MAMPLKQALVWFICFVPSSLLFIYTAMEIFKFNSRDHGALIALIMLLISGVFSNFVSSRVYKKWKAKSDKKIESEMNNAER